MKAGIIAYFNSEVPTAVDPYQQQQQSYSPNDILLQVATTIGIVGSQLTNYIYQT